MTTNGLSASAVLASVRDLPALPAVVLELIESLADEAFGAHDLAAKISSDPALAAKTLRLANSSFYGMSRQVTSITDATAILGFRTLRGVVVAAGIAGHFEGALCPGLDFKAFWRHSFGTALCSAALAKVLRLDEGLAFMLGLLHDIGRLALANGFPEAYGEVLDCQRLRDCPALEAERTVLGIDHAVVGGLIAEHWHFAPRVAQAIASHHEPVTPGDGRPTFADLIHVADNVAHALDLSHAEADLVPPLSMPSWSRLALDEATWRQVFARTEAEHQSVCAALLD